MGLRWASRRDCESSRKGVLRSHTSSSNFNGAKHGTLMFADPAKIFCRGAVPGLKEEVDPLCPMGSFFAGGRPP